MSNLKKIRKAVFPVAGLGTRFLPATKAMPKELLPIIDKPIIQFAVEEAVVSGIDTLIFVTGRNKRAVEDHFDTHFELTYLLQENQKTDEVNMIQNMLPDHVECIFVRQPQQLGLGHAVLCAERVVGSEPFAVLLADDYILEAQHGIKSLIDAYDQSPSNYLSVMAVSDGDCSKYGIIDAKPNGCVRGLVEKPAQGSAPSNLASIGRYVLNPEIFDILRNQSPGYGGEIQLADAIHQLALMDQVRYRLLQSQRFDCGSKSGYLEAIIAYAKQHEVYQEIVHQALVGCE